MSESDDWEQTKQFITNNIFHPHKHLTIHKLSHNIEVMNVPESYRTDIDIAHHYLKSEGCSDVYLFGSVAKNQTSLNSDIDIAVKGLDASRFFRVYGKLMGLLTHQVDLISLDFNEDFAKELITSDSLIHLG